MNVLDAVYDTILSLLRGQLDKRTVLDNLELVLLTIDEVVSLFCWRCCQVLIAPLCPTVCRLIMVVLWN